MPFDAVEGEDLFEEPFAVEVPESEVRSPADPLFGLFFCLVAEEDFAELLFEPELAPLVFFDAPVFDELELFADLLVLDPPADLPAGRELA